MIIKQYSDKSMKIHFEDEDEYEVTDDNGVDIWLSKDEVNRIAEYADHYKVDRK